MHGASNSDGESSPEKTARDVPSGTLADSIGPAEAPLASAEVGDHENVVFPDRYDIKEEIARGGIGRILRAHDLRLDREVALKELHRNDPTVVERFLREIRITAQLQHPNIIPLHEGGRWPNGQPFYAMKLVDGKTFGQALSEASGLVGRLLLLPTLVDVAEALAYAHGQGIMHRDLKPANVLVGPFGETVVIDWGLAKHVDEPEERLPAMPASTGYETSLGVVVGTPAYMPPEQAQGRAVDRRADVYALGAMLYHLVAGRSPYADAGEDVLARVRASGPISLHRLTPDAPRDLVAISHKAMARDPDGRYPTAREMAEELRSYLTGGLVGAYRYGFLELLQRFYERRRAVVLTVVLALIALLVAGAASFGSIKQQRDRAKINEQKAEAARLDAQKNVDELLVEKARALLDRDPTSSIAQLKKPKGTPHDAATIAAWAEERGVAEQVLHGHLASATTVAYSPDGTLLATGGEDRRAVLWNTADWSKSTELEGHADKVTKVIFSPDGNLVATGCYDKKVRLYGKDGSLVRVLTGHGAAVKAIAFSNDSRELCSIDTEGEVRVWDAVTGAYATHKSAADRDLYCSFSPDGAYVLSGSHAGSLQLLKVATGAVRTLSGHKGSVRSAAFAPDGASIVSGGDDGTIRVWPINGSVPKIIGQDTATVQIVSYSPDAKFLASAGMSGRVLLWNLALGTSRVVSEHAERVAALAFSADGRYVASSGWDKVVRVHDLRTEARTVLRGHGDVVVALAFSPDGTHLASASWDKTVRVWNAHHTHERRVLVGHTVGVRTVAFSPDGKLLASGGHDNTVRVWHPDTGESRVFVGHTDHVYKVVFSPDGEWVASSSDDRTVRLWSVKDDRVRVLTGHTDDVEELAFSPDGTRLASASEDHTARLWPMTSGPPIVLEHDHQVTAVAFDWTGALLATASRDRTVRLWDGHSGKPGLVLRGHTDDVSDVVFSHDGLLLASASADDSVLVWNVDGTRRARFGSLSGAHIVAFSPKGGRVAVGGAAPKLWLCDIASVSCTELRGHSAVVHDLAFLDENTLATASGDSTVQIWDLKTEERRVLEGHAAPVFGLAVSPDGRTIASASGDANVRLWAVVRPPSADALRAFLDGLSYDRFASGIPRDLED